MKNKARNRIISILLTLVLLLGCLPVTAFAADGDAPAPDGDGGTATPGITKQAGVTFTIAEDEFGETAFFLPENEPITEADLLAGVTATDENGTPVTVTVKDADGLDMANPQMRGAYPNPPYVITYAAAHPVSGDEFTETRELYVTLGVGAIMPMAGGNITWNGAAPDISGWTGTGNVITVDTGATGTLEIPTGVDELTINGNGNTILGQIAFYPRTTNVKLTLNNVTINSDSTSFGAVHKNDTTGDLTLVIEGTVKLKGQTGGSNGGSGVHANGNLIITGSGTLEATGGEGGSNGHGGMGIYVGGTFTNSVKITAKGGNGGSGGSGVAAAGNITNDGTIIAIGGNAVDSTNGIGGAGGHGVLAYSGNIVNSGTITATGGDGGNYTGSTGDDGGAGGSGVRSNSGSITNNAGGTIATTGGDGGDSTGGAGGAGGDGAYASSSITNNAGIAAFRAMGGLGGSGSQSGANGQAASGTTVTGTIIVGPNVTFAAQGSVNLINPANLVFNVNNPTPITGYAFESISFKNVTQNTNFGQRLYSSDGILYNNGTLTVPAAAFGQHGGSPLTPGVYRALISLKNGGTFYDYYTDFTLTGIFDAGSDAHFSFNGNYADLAKVLLNSTELNQDGIDQRSAHLNGYGGYADNLGLVEAGSVNVTLYKEFLRTLANGTYTLEVEFNDGSTGSLQFQIQQQASGQTSGSGSSARSPAPASTWLERDPAAALAQSAKNRGEDYVRTKVTGIYGVRGNAWEKLAELRYEHDTTEAGTVQVRVYVKNPEKLKKDTRVSGYVKGADVETVKNRFEKWFKNELRVIHFDHQGAWGQPVDIAAKVDFTGMDTKNLYFYTYSKATNSYRRIEKPAYWIDKNGYLHFTTEYVGDIIISDGVLDRK